MSSKKKVIILNIPPPFGGGEIRAKLLYDYFKDNTSFIVLTNSNESKNKSNQGKVSLSNIKINILYILRNCKVILRYKPSLVYISIPKSFFPILKIVPTIIACKLVKSKLVGELAGRSFYFLEENDVQKKIGLKILKKFDSIRVLGASVQETLEDYGLKKTIVIDNGIEFPNDWKIQAKKDISKDKQIQLLFIGALNKQKGIFVTLEIIKKLKDLKINFHFNIVGEWSSEADKLSSFDFISKNKLEENITFHGILHKEDKWKVLEESDIFVFPSFNEGQPLVVIEAMAFGIPLVSSNVGAIPDTIENEINGFMINGHNASDYTDKIIELIKNQKLFLEISKANINTYEKRFTASNYCKNIHSWIDLQSIKILK